MERGPSGVPFSCYRTGQGKENAAKFMVDIIDLELRRSVAKGAPWWGLSAT